MLGIQAATYPLLKNIVGWCGPPRAPGGRWETGWCWFVPGKHLVKKSQPLVNPLIEGSAVLFVSWWWLQTWWKVARRGPPREPMVPGSVRPEGRNPVCRARQTAPPCDTSGLRTGNSFSKSFSAMRRRRIFAHRTSCVREALHCSGKEGLGPTQEQVRNCAAPLLKQMTLNPIGCGEKDGEERENTVRKRSFLAADRLQEESESRRINPETQVAGWGARLRRRTWGNGNPYRGPPDNRRQEERHSERTWPRANCACARARVRGV